MQEMLEAAAAAVADAPLPQRGAAAAAPPAAAAAGGRGAAVAGNGVAAAEAEAEPVGGEDGSSLDGPAPLLQAKQLKPKSATDRPMLAGGDGD